MFNLLFKIFFHSKRICMLPVKKMHADFKILICFLIIFLLFNHTTTYAVSPEDNALTATVSDTEHSPWNIDIVAHRGYSVKYPDNTLAAFQGAIDAGATAVEFDLRKTSDGHLVVYHDDTVAKLTKRKTTKKGIKDLTFEQVRKLDNGSWFSPEFAGEKIPTFDEVLTLFADTDIQLFIELKNIGDDEDFTHQVYYTLKAYDMLDRVVISSFRSDYLQQIKALNFCVPTMKLAGYGRLDLAKRCYADYYGVNMRTLTPTAVTIYHQAGAKVYSYTPVSATQAMALQNMGVDGLICDFVSADEFPLTP